MVRQDKSKPGRITPKGTTSTPGADTPGPSGVGRTPVKVAGPSPLVVPVVMFGSLAIGTLTSFFGAYASFFLDGATGGIIVTLQTLIFLAAFVFAPKHGLIAARRKAAEALRGPAGPTASLPSEMARQ